MIGIAAVAMTAAFTSCSKDKDFEQISQVQLDESKYQAAFESRFGKIAPNHDWGFNKYKKGANARALTRANAGQNYPATSTGINANANEWADPNKQYGGWLVPPRLTDKQKLRVYRYFQTHPDLGYEDPHFRHFFVQQCYTGGFDQYGDSPENVTAANTSTYTSANMNHMTVGVDHQHINNFNAGSYGVEAGSNYGTEGDTGVGVLDNGYTVNDYANHHHNDEIMLMVNIDDTSCFGYHESGASVQRDDKMALVSAQTIDDWANSAEAKSLGIDLGDAVVDDWGRSFLGFDHALLNIEEALTDVNLTYQNQYSVQCNWGWDGEKVVPLRETSINQWGYLEYGNFLPQYGNVLDKNNQPVRYFNTNANFYISFDQIQLTGEYNLNETKMEDVSEELLNNVLIFKDAKIERTAEEGRVSNNKDHVLNLALIKKLADDGYRPINNAGNNAKWIKAGDSDGYYSDWIVTLTEAQRTITLPKADVRVIVEDMQAAEEWDGVKYTGDFDFNDVVFDVVYDYDGTQSAIILQAAGGTLPLYVDGHEVHGTFGEYGTGEMINTGAGPNAPSVVVPLGKKYTDARDIKVTVSKKNAKGVEEEIELKAEEGRAPHKIAVPIDFDWMDERRDIESYYTGFSAYVKDPNARWTLSGDE